MKGVAKEAHMKPIPIPELAGFDGYVRIASRAAHADEAYVRTQEAAERRREVRALLRGLREMLAGLRRG